MNLIKGAIVVLMLLIAVATCTVKPPSTENLPDPKPAQVNAASEPTSTPASAALSGFNSHDYHLLANRIAFEYLRVSGGATGSLRPLFTQLPALLAVDSIELNQRAARNIAALDRQLDGKRLLVLGHILGVRKNPVGRGYVVELPGGWASFDDDEAFVAGLQPGLPEHFVCTYIAGLATVGYGLDGCKRMEREAEQAGRMIALSTSMLDAEGRAELQRLLGQARRRADRAPAVCTQKVSVTECADLVEPEPDAPTAATQVESAPPAPIDPQQ